MACLHKMLAKSPARQMRFADPIAAESSVHQAVMEGRAFISHGYFIMVDVGPAWYSQKSFLIEQIILKVEDTDDDVRLAVRHLDDIARQFGCEAIAVGDTQIGLMTPKYLAEGYTFLGTQLFKEVPHGIHSQDHGHPGAD